MSFQIYVPYICNIIAVTKGQQTIVTLAIPHAFVLGSLVAFSIPQSYGMRQLDQQKGYVELFDEFSITVTIDSTTFDPFVIPTVPPTYVLDPALAIPAGDANSGYSAPGAVQPPYLTIPGAFEATIP
jgi:hypothetical protein